MTDYKSMFERRCAILAAIDGRSALVMTDGDPDQTLTAIRN